METPEILHNKTFLVAAGVVALVALYVVTSKKSPAPAPVGGAGGGGNNISPGADIKSISEALQSAFAPLLKNQLDNQTALAGMIGDQAQNTVGALNAETTALATGFSAISNQNNQNSQALSGALSDQFNKSNTTFGGFATDLAIRLNGMVTSLGYILQAMNQGFGKITSQQEQQAAIQVANNNVLQNIAYRQLGATSAASCAAGGNNWSWACIDSKYAIDKIVPGGGNDAQVHASIEQSLQQKYSSCFNNNTFDLACVGKLMTGGQ